MTKQQIILTAIILIILLGGMLYLVTVPTPPVIPEKRPEVRPEEGVPGPVEAPGEEAPVGEEEITPEEPVVEPWQTPEEPIESPPLEEAEIPGESIKLTMTTGGFSPDTFEVKRGAEVTLTIINGDERTHIFKFEAEILADVAVGIGPHDPIRAITFYAPDIPGEYPFYCDVPGHGETGKMIVK